MHKYELAVVKALKDSGRQSISALAENTGLSRDKVMWAVENLSSTGAVKVDRTESKSYALTKEAERYLAGDFPEEALLKTALSKKQVVNGQTDKIGLMWAKKNGWITINNGSITPTENGASMKLYALRAALVALSEGRPVENGEIDSAMRRGLIVSETSHSDPIVTLAKQVFPEGETGIGALTRDMITTGRWKSANLRPYDITIESGRTFPARRHPMREFINRIRDIWLRMGFIEVSGPMIEPAFWNFDALFVPQDHPARDMQDTFFLSNPTEIDVDEIEVLHSIGSSHEKGWSEKFNTELSKRALLRTHTTSVSVRNVRRFAKMVNASEPVKLFSIGKVFRNEAIDYKHLAELHMVDGIMIGDGLTLSNLIYTLKDFMGQLGLPKARFKPSYFPFVEPGLEIHYFNEDLGEEVELAGAGVMRREITKAMGTDKAVLAWGIGVERLIMRSIKIDSLSDLYRNGIGWLNKREELKV